jgi:hypothetical protein
MNFANMYEYRKQVQKLYIDSTKGLVKGNIYNELNELKLDYDFIDEIKTDSNIFSVTFTIKFEKYSKTVYNILISRIKETIKSFVLKNVQNPNNEMIEFLNSNLLFDIYQLNSDSHTIMVRL